jgi:hypothetical protein
MNAIAIAQKNQRKSVARKSFITTLVYIYIQNTTTKWTLQFRTFRYSGEGKVFSWTFGIRHSFVSQSEFATKNKLILRGAIVGGSWSLEGPQKHV